MAASNKLSVENTMTEKSNEKYWKEMSSTEKFNYIYDRITLEPMVACFVLPSMLLMLGVQNLNLDKACRVNLGYNQTICDALRNRDTGNYSHHEVEIQKLVATMTGWKQAINSAIPCFVILFIGSWSDRHNRRKPCILIPLCGQILMAFALLLCVYFENSPIEAAIFVEVFFPSITGSHFTMMVGFYSYIADITTEKERTVRIGIISLVYSIGIPFGMAFSGILIRRIGFYGVFTLAGSLYTLALFYGIFILKEVPPKKTVAAAVAAPEQKDVKQKTLIADFFDLAHVRETFNLAFNSTDPNRRKKIILLMVIVIIVVGPQHGEMSLFYLFTRFKFNWSEVEFSFFQTYNMAIHLIGTTFSVSIFSSLLKIDDAIIGAIANGSKVLSSFVYAFSMVEWHMYIGPISEIVGGASSIAMRSLASKIVHKQELGKINSLFGIVESIAPLVYSPILAKVYSMTLEEMPGAFFLVGGLMTVPGIFLFFCIYKINRSERKESKKQMTNNVTLSTLEACEKVIEGDNNIFVITSAKDDECR